MVNCRWHATRAVVGNDIYHTTTYCSRALAPLFISFLAILAEPIAAGSRTPFVTRNIAAGRTCAVVVVNSILLWFGRFVDGVKLRNRWHDDLLSKRLKRSQLFALTPLTQQLFDTSTAFQRRPSAACRRAVRHSRQRRCVHCSGNRIRPSSDANALSRNAGKRPSCRA